MRNPLVNLDQLVTFYFVATEKRAPTARRRACLSESVEGRSDG